MKQIWLVDGMNVIGSRPTGWWRDRTGAMRALVERLERFSEEAGEEVAVVFDGRPREVGGGGSIEVEFAPGGPNAADDAIAARVEAAEDPARLIVVTSDRALAERVRAAGAEVHPARRFAERLES